MTEHREKRFTFADGSIAAACSVKNCTWGKRLNDVRFRKRHSEGTVSVELPDDEPADTEVAELSVSDMLTRPAVTGEVGLVPEPPIDRVHLDAEGNVCYDQREEEVEEGQDGN